MISAFSNYISATKQQYHHQRALFNHIYSIFFAIHTMRQRIAGIKEKLKVDQASSFKQQALNTFKQDYVVKLRQK